MCIHLCMHARVHVDTHVDSCSQTEGLQERGSKNMRPSATSWSLHAPPDSESSLEVLFAVDEASSSLQPPPAGIGY